MLLYNLSLFLALNLSVTTLLKISYTTRGIMSNYLLRDDCRATDTCTDYMLKECV